MVVVLIFLMNFITYYFFLFIELLYFRLFTPLRVLIIFTSCIVYFVRRCEGFKG